MPYANSQGVRIHYRRALAAAAKERSSLEGVLGTIAVPRMLFAGEEDSRCPAAHECAQHIPRATVVSLPGQTYVTGFVRSDLVVPHILRFLATTPC